MISIVMKKLIYILILSIVGLAAAISTKAAPARAKEKITPVTPDLEQIRADVSNPSSPYYYPKLFSRYQQNETVMNLEEYRHLYYGALFQEDFNPYRHSEASTKNDGLYYKNNHTRAELDSIIYYAEEVLADDPFNLSQMNYLIYALRARGKVNRAKIWQYRLNHLLQAIISSGTGTDQEHAWYEEPYFDRIEVEKKGGKKGKVTTDTYYFNIRNMLEEYYRKFPDEQ